MLRLCTDDRFFSLTDEDGCFGDRLHTVNHLIIELPLFDPLHPLWNMENIVTLLVPSLSQALSWDQLDIRPVSIEEKFSETYAIDLGFLHVSGTHRLLAPNKFFFHNGAHRSVLHTTITAYLHNIDKSLEPEKIIYKSYVLGFDFKHRPYVTYLDDEPSTDTHIVIVLIVVLPIICFGYMACNYLKPAEMTPLRN